MFQVKSVIDVKEELKIRASKLNRRVTRLPLNSAVGYQVAEDVISLEDLPHFNRSTVDGYAVVSKVCSHASDTTPLILPLAGEVLMGKASSVSVNSSQTVYVPTGGALPEGADAVVMVEYCETLQNEVVIQGSVAKWENVLRIGSDIAKGSLILSKGMMIHDRLLGLLSACGVVDVLVFEPLTCLVISTGDEIVPTNSIPKIGEVRDINSLTVREFVKKHGIQVEKSIVIKDNFELYKQEVLKGFKYYDLIISSGGSSVGEKDYTERVLMEIGAEIFTHGMNIKPGKPTVLAQYQEQLFLGLPGQPTSAFMVLNEVLHSVLEGVYNKSIPVPYVEKVLGANVHAAPGKRTYQLVQIDEESAYPIFTKSGMISGLSRADGYIVIEENKEGLRKGTEVRVYLF